jgi:hypothetical protein
MPDGFRWRTDGYDDEDAADDRLLNQQPASKGSEPGEAGRGLPWRGAVWGGAAGPDMAGRAMARPGMGGAAGAIPPAPNQPLGDPTAGWRNQISQHQQVADAQRRRAARAEARLNQLRGDILWIALFVGPGCFVLGWFLAWLWTTWRR